MLQLFLLTRNNQQLGFLLIALCFSMWEGHWWVHTWYSKPSLFFSRFRKNRILSLQQASEKSELWMYGPFFSLCLYENLRVGIFFSIALCYAEGRGCREWVPEFSFLLECSCFHTHLGCRNLITCF